MQKKLMHGLGMAALVEDADGAGYLGLEDSNAAQQARMEFSAYCEGLAAEYLRANGQATMAKQRLRADICQIGTATDTGRFDDEESALFDRFAVQIDAAIDRLATKAGWQRAMILWFFRIPGFVKAWIFVAVCVAVAILLGKVFGK
ncbi:MAG: hypothetical protein LBV50_02380 [Novosphingobium sp.]|nr:hypothetical protein [Novosphingobium sp.]